MNCTRCGRRLEIDFRFCPVCGLAVDGSRSFEIALDGSFARMEHAEAAASFDRLAELDNDLRILENELDDLAESGQRLRIRRR